MQPLHPVAESQQPTVASTKEGYRSPALQGPDNELMEVVMAGCFGSTAEDRYRERELNRFYAQQEAEELRAERVEERTKQLMQVSEDYHPWTFENFTEAIENAPEAQRKTLFACVSEAVSAGLNNDHANHLAMVAMRQTVERYWTECAAKAADAEEA